MYDSDDFLAAKRSAGNTTIKRVFFFTHPVVAYRVKMHKMFGDDIIAFKVDFLGSDDISQKNPFKDGTIEKSIGLITIFEKVFDNLRHHIFYYYQFKSFHVRIALEYTKPDQPSGHIYNRWQEHPVFRWLPQHRIPN